MLLVTSEHIYKDPCQETQTDKQENSNRQAKNYLLKLFKIEVQMFSKFDEDFILFFKQFDCAVHKKIWLHKKY